MAIKVALNHQTRYKFDRSVNLSPHIIRLWPAPHTRTAILSRSLKIKPAKHFINWQQDAYSNYLARVVFNEMTTELSIEMDLVAEMTVINPFDFFMEPACEDYPFEYNAAAARELIPFLEAEKPGPLMAAFLEKISRRKRRTIDFIVELNQSLQHQIKYIIRMEPGVQTCEQTLGLKSGSCRDSAWLLAQIFRHMGLASRFVSGYLIQLKPDVKPIEGPEGSSSDFTDLHAWTEVYVPGAGWIGLDPTSGLLAGEGHIPLACTAEPSAAAPVEGMTDKCEVEFSHSMSVTRVFETPRVTKPYSPEQWQAIEDLGHQVDRDLVAHDVRLTMGGEPTFVAIDNRDDPEWNTEAMGPHKRKLGGVLIKRLRERFAPGGLLHHGQGKWYPGEQLPRWAFGCYWRKDGEPVWHDPKLIADDDKNPGFKVAHAHDFVRTLAKKLSIEEKFAIPAFEDAWHYMLQERRLPVNVDPLNSRLDDEMTRERIAKIFDQGLNSVVGYTLPLQRRLIGNEVRWVSGPWFLRREHLFLLPGDSSMGFRLPLDSLPWSVRDDGAISEIDPLADLPPLPSRDTLQRFIVPGSPQWASRKLHWPRWSGQPTPGRAPRSEEARRAAKDPVDYDVVRTALCVEPRNGFLHIFMPPQRYLEDYLNLAAAVEATAQELHFPVLIEGYTPPHDSRLNVLKVTPDPGVIEVNVHPAATWEELVSHTNILHEEARQSRLATEKFMLDGRHTGTGGGNHVIIGGATPQDSPVLRRPDLLKSLVSFWHNHPSLSFLFSGLFLGPTSQHPRVDEARMDSVYELEVAFRQIQSAQGNNAIPPWQVDRLLRNLLIDSTGNTHRTEFCIDKLYSPDSSTGRLGLVELRSFEMPPHPQMSLAQQLLLRTMVAKFWKQPYSRRLVRWGTELHDRFMLPHFVEQDFRDVIDEIAADGYPLKAEWFEPHLNFRFPAHGAFTQQGVFVEVRQALEPWHVLGEENAAGGTARYVDSSLERVQVKVDGMTGSRHMVTCNGRALPLHPTGTNGQYVAGVRYRAWQPPSCLQPHIGIHSPLVFDLYDDWSRRSLGGCTYHVVHPGGRGVTTLPVNANEAEGRRAARFSVTGHTPGKMAPRIEDPNPEFPFTLDLRLV